MKGPNDKKGFSPRMKVQPRVDSLLLFGACIMLPKGSRRIQSV